MILTSNWHHPFSGQVGVSALTSTARLGSCGGDGGGGGGGGGSTTETSAQACGAAPCRAAQFLIFAGACFPDESLNESGNANAAPAASGPGCVHEKVAATGVQVHGAGGAASNDTDATNTSS